MEFKKNKDIPDIDSQELLQVKKSEMEQDQELLQIQKRKSAPRVVVEEYVQIDSDEDEPMVETNKKEEQKESESNDQSKVAASDNSQVKAKFHRLKTHIEIDNVSPNHQTRLFYNKRNS